MKTSDIILNENTLDEGFWDDIKTAYTSGRDDYIKRKAAELGMTPQNVIATANKKTGGKVAGQTSNTPNAIRQRNSRAAAKGGAAAPVPVAGKPGAAPPPVAAASVPGAVPAVKPRVRVPAGSAPGAAPVAGKPAAVPGAAPVAGKPAAVPGAAPVAGKPAAVPGAAPVAGKPAPVPVAGKPVAGKPVAGKPAPVPGAAGGAPAAAPTAPVTFDAVKQSVAGLSKKEKQKVLTQLLSDLGTPVNK